MPHVALPRNIGFAAAINLAVARTEAPAVLVLNADTVLEPGCVATLLAVLEDDSRLGGVQPRILQMERGEKGSTADARLYSAGQALTRDGRAYERGMGEAQAPWSAERREVFGVCGAACLLRREAFEAVGGYDESYFAFYEDVDLNVRARIDGWRFEYVPGGRRLARRRRGLAGRLRAPRADNARLVARNRLATQVKFMPLAAAPRIAAVECGVALARRPGAALAGDACAASWLRFAGCRGLLRERRRLRLAGNPSSAVAGLAPPDFGSPKGWSWFQRCCVLTLSRVEVELERSIDSGDFDVLDLW